jgi:hypothetical protein
MRNIQFPVNAARFHVLGALHSSEEKQANRTVVRYIHSLGDVPRRNELAIFAFEEAKASKQNRGYKCSFSMSRSVI